MNIYQEISEKVLDVAASYTIYTGLKAVMEKQDGWKAHMKELRNLLSKHMDAIENSKSLAKIEKKAAKAIVEDNIAKCYVYAMIDNMQLSK